MFPIHPTGGRSTHLHILRAGVGAVINQQAHDVRVSLRARGNECCPLKCCVDGGDVCAHGQQVLDGVDVAAERGGDKRSCAVLQGGGCAGRYKPYTRS